MYMYERYGKYTDNELEIRYGNCNKNYEIKEVINSKATSKQYECKSQEEIIKYYVSLIQ